jgi:hypothetical protein
MILFLFGCSEVVSSATYSPTQTSEVSSLTINQQIQLLTAAAQEVIGEVRTPEGFYAIATSLPEAIKKQMLIKKSWHQGCPVELSNLSYVVLTHWGFNGQLKVGELVVHRKLALPVMHTFADLFAEHYPIEKMELIENYAASDDRSMAANNSSAFNCRDISGKPGVFSKHSYGSAIDINPLLNPYVAPKSDALTAMGWDSVENKGEFLCRNGYDAPSPALKFCTERPSDCFVLPPTAAEYADRSKKVPGYLHADSAAVKAFTDQGFDWGGNWSSLLDYQHFEYANARLMTKE